MQLVFKVLFVPETTHSAYYGKKEQRLDTTCFSLWPPTSIKERILLEFYSQDYIDIIVLLLNNFPFESNAII